MEKKAADSPYKPKSLLGMVALNGLDKTIKILGPPFRGTSNIPESKKSDKK